MPGAIAPPGIRSWGIFVNMKRITFLVDGFNLYGSIREILESHSINTKWLNIKSLLTSYFHLIDKYGKLEEIYYFTAIQNYLKAIKPDKIKKHLNYIKCLESTGIIIIKGRFKVKNVCYKNENCQVYLKKHEEKETDVAIAIKLFELFYLDKCDICVIVTGDTDLVPAVKTCQIHFPLKKIIFFIPYNRSHNKELQTIAPSSIAMNFKQYISHQFPTTVILTDGTKITKPANW